MAKGKYGRKNDRRDSPYEDRREQGGGGRRGDAAVYAGQANGQGQGWQDWQAGATRPPPPSFAPAPPFFPNPAAPPFGSLDWGPYGQPYAPQPGPSNWQAWGPPIPPFQPHFPSPGFSYNDVPFVPAPVQPFFHPTPPTQTPFSPSAPLENGWHNDGPPPRRGPRQFDSRQSLSGAWRTDAPRYERRSDTLRNAPSQAPAYSADGAYIAPARRERTGKRQGPVYPPTQTYLDAANVPSVTLETEEAVGARDPPALILDLNNTLLVRGERNSAGSKMPVVRPYLATFLDYICTSTEPDLVSGKPRFQPIVYSSARSHNVLSMLAALNLIPHARIPERPNFRGPPPSSPSGNRSRSRSPTPPPRHGDYAYVPAPYKPDPSHGDVLKLVFTREMMGLSESDYHGDVETVKDLAKVWERLGWAEEREADGASARRRSNGGEDGSGGALTPAEAARRDEMGAQRSLLLDDEAGKAAQQPYSHLPIRPYLVHPSLMPRPIFNARRSRSPSPASQSDLPQHLRALEVEDDHPPAWDDALLRSVWELENLRRESNIAAAVKSGFLGRLRDDARAALEKTKEGKEVTVEMVDAELAGRGRMVCEKLGIQVRRKWDPRWRQKVLRRREAKLEQDRDTKERDET